MCRKVTTTKRRKVLAILIEKNRRRGRAGRRAARRRRQASNDRDRARGRELVIATHNARDDGCGWKARRGRRAAEVLNMYQEMGLRHPSVCGKRGEAASLLFSKLDMLLTAAAVESGGDGGREEGANVELDWLFARVSPMPKHDPPEFISDRLLKVTLGLCGRARAVTFIVGYMHRQTFNLLGKKHALLDSSGKGREGSAGARTVVCVNGRQRAHGTEEGRGRGGSWGSEECKVIGCLRPRYPQR